MLEFQIVFIIKHGEIVISNISNVVGTSCKHQDLEQKGEAYVLQNFNCMGDEWLNNFLITYIYIYIERDFFFDNIENEQTIQHFQNIKKFLTNNYNIYLFL
uniref:Uncharacterized protein n=1 Tax=Cajanus cajan TaxID=3821 RepID=A0A151SK57_CAJCA|nr:hypothetical protein KK1_001385 [Cajanus cajan]